MTEQKVIQIFLKNGFHYKGDLDNQDNFFITILDHKTNSKISIAKTEIRQIKELHQ